MPTGLWKSRSGCAAAAGHPAATRTSSAGWTGRSAASRTSSSTTSSARPRSRCRAADSAPQLGALGLAAAGLRQLGGELDDAGELVGRGLAFAVLLELAD